MVHLSINQARQLLGPQARSVLALVERVKDIDPDNLGEVDCEATAAITAALDTAWSTGLHTPRSSHVEPMWKRKGPFDTMPTKYSRAAAIHLARAMVSEAMGKVDPDSPRAALRAIAANTAVALVMRDTRRTDGEFTDKDYDTLTAEWSRLVRNTKRQS